MSEHASPLRLQFSLGVGQADTHALFLSDGSRNRHPHAGTPSGAIAAPEIAAMVAAPQSVAKAGARWFLPSSSREFDARTHGLQAEKGRFHWSCLDVDTNNLSLDELRSVLNQVVPGTGRLIYASRSSTEDAKRWCALLPLHQPVCGSDYTDMATAFYQVLEDASGGRVVPDRGLALVGQLVYLPNRGEHYEYDVVRAPSLVLPPDHPVMARLQADRRATEAARLAASERRKERQRERPLIGAGSTPVQRFSGSNSIADLLTRYGHMRLGASDHWRSPYQSSGTYATQDFGDHWVSLSGSDASAGLGAVSERGSWKEGHGTAMPSIAMWPMSIAATLPPLCGAVERTVIAGTARGPSRPGLSGT